MTLRIQEKIQAALKDGVFSGAQFIVASPSEIYCEVNEGMTSSLAEARPVTAGTLFDVASLTKPIVTTSVFLLLIQQKKISLDTRVAQWIPAFAEEGKDKITVRHLLKHTSGLPAWRPYFEEMKKEKPEWVGKDQGRQWILEKICQEGLETPPGYQRLYSDLGFIVLGELCQVVTGERIDHFFDRELALPLNLEFSFYNPLEMPHSKSKGAFFAATESCPWRKKVLSGEVHDDNAYAMGGVAGHAGLFQTAGDCHRFVSALTSGLKGGGFFSQDLLVEFIAPRNQIKAGWDIPSEGSQAGRYFAKGSIGHLGYTGCSVWIDLDQGFHMVLFTNRVHPSRSDERIKIWRPELHNIAYEDFIRKG
ncbi:MAG: serine hydrolase domain-containing protein [Deltaproteobacteria bacterium]|nr:serine hydrolase domain-containing protein [Deltaproteobacteria bacterium]